MQTLDSSAILSPLGGKLSLHRRQQTRGGMLVAMSQTKSEEERN